MSNLNREKNKLSVAILYGGKSGEHEVSLRSAYSVYTHLDSSQFTPLLIGIDIKGRWYLQPENPETLNDTLQIITGENRLVFAAPGDGLYCGGKKLPSDFVFPVLHGSFGEDGTVQGLLELCGLPYAGAGVLGSSLAMDKAATKTAWSAAGLPIVPFLRVDSQELTAEGSLKQETADRIRSTFSGPLFVKPLRAGSSVGVSRADSWNELEPALHEALRFDTAAIVEPAVNAREVECSVIGNFTTETFIPGEILPTHSFYDYEAKYIDPDGAVLQLPADLPAEDLKKIQEIASKAYLAAGTEGMARVDFFVDKTSGEILLNEINTIPGFTSISMFPRMCEAGGLDYRDLISRMIFLGLERHRRREECVYSVLTKTGVGE